MFLFWQISVESSALLTGGPRRSSFRRIQPCSEPVKPVPEPGVLRREPLDLAPKLRGIPGLRAGASAEDPPVDSAERLVGASVEEPVVAAERDLRGGPDRGRDARARFHGEEPDDPADLSPETRLL